MATADSIIRVSIIGDAKKLDSAIGKADKGLGGLLKTGAAAVGGLFALDKGFEFAQGAIQEADRLGDAITRLNISIGETNTKKLEEEAGHFKNLGLSSQDVLELSANFADLATNAGISSTTIADLGDDVAATAAAMSLLDDSDPAGNVDLITKAAKGNAKAMQALGIAVSDAEVEARALADTGKTTAASLTDGERATARLNIVLDKLKPKLDAATTGSGDLEQSQRTLQASVEDLQAKLGGPLADALKVVVDFINDEIDAIPHAVDGFKSLGTAITDFASFVATPLANLNDVLGQIGDNIARANENARNTPRTPRGPAGSSGVPRSDSGTVRAVQRVTERKGGIGNSLGGP